MAQEISPRAWDSFAHAPIPRARTQSTLQVEKAKAADAWRLLFRLEGRVLDDLLISCGFGFHEGIELIDRERGDIGALIAQALVGFRIHDDLVDLGIEPRDDIRRCALWCEEPNPEDEVELRNIRDFGDGRN